MMASAYELNETPEQLWPGLPTAPYVVITPYLLPPGTAKRVNHGDGFILDACVRLIGHRPALLLSSRAPLDAGAIAAINRAQCVVLAGANSLKDDFAPAPGFDRLTLARIQVPMVPFGVGHYGVADVTRMLTPAAAEILTELHRRFPYSSVRCDASYRYLAGNLPALADRILMTSCPVVHVADGVDRGFERRAIYEQAVVTVTDRVRLDEQLSLLGLTRTLFRARRWILALHQDYGNAALDSYATRLGFEVFRCTSYRDLSALYAATDLHFGNRLHAHLKCLANGIISFLCPFDLRQTYFAESLDFPLVTNGSLDAVVTYDFGRVRRRLAQYQAALDRFLSALRPLVLGAPGLAAPAVAIG